MDDGIGFECLVDPEANFYERVGIGRVTWLHWLRPRVIANYVRSRRSGYRQGRMTGDPLRLSGVVVVDSSAVVRWAHLAAAVGDYPAVDSVVLAATIP
jgi:hypothetical protein